MCIRDRVSRRADAANEYARSTRTAHAAAEYHERLAADLNAGALNLHDVRLDPFTGLPVFDVSATERARASKENVVTLPIDTSYLTTVVPHSRPDLVPILEHTTRHACICMGVPPASMGVVGSHTNSEASVTEDVLKATLLRHRRILTRCLVDVYTGLYGKRHDLTVVFPSLLSTTIARSLYDAQIMTYEAFCKHVRDTFSVSHKDLNRNSPDLNPPNPKRPKQEEGKPTRPDTPRNDGKD